MFQRSVSLWLNRFAKSKRSITGTMSRCRILGVGEIQLSGRLSSERCLYPTPQGHFVSLNIAKCVNSSSNNSETMTAALLLCLLAFHQASLAPQYADQTNQELSGNQLDVFGDSQVEEVDSAHTVKNEAGYTAPDDSDVCC